MPGRDKKAALEKSEQVAEKLRKMKLSKATENLTYMDFPEEYWKMIRTNNEIERLNREIRRRTLVVGRESALMLVCARPRHVINS